MINQSIIIEQKKTLKRKKSLERYYQKKQEILTYQKERLKRKYKEDETFRKKRKLRDHTRFMSGGIENLKGYCCSQCSSIQKLERHHPSYDKPVFVILCKKCHNKIHHDFSIKNGKVYK